MTRAENNVFNIRLLLLLGLKKPGSTIGLSYLSNKKNEASFFLWYTALCVYYAVQCGSTFSKYKQNPMVKP